MLKFRTAVCLLAVMSWVGCVSKAPLRGPQPPPAEEAQTPRQAVLAHLTGPWELPGKDGIIKQMIFAPGGQLTFQGGLEYFNPGTWELDFDRQELVITLPHTSNENLDVFHMYLGDGVKAFDRSRKQVTYHFDANTWTLNVGGWTYTKPDKPVAAAEAEPVFK